MNYTINLIIIILFPSMLYGQYDISIGTGSHWLNSDVNVLCGLGSLNYANGTIDYQVKDEFYLTGNIGYGNAKGLNQYFAFNGFALGGGLVEDIYKDYSETIYAPYFSSNILSISAGPSFKQYLANDNIFVKVGFQIGLSHARTYMNLYDAENNIYMLPTLLTLGAFGPQEPIYTQDLFDDTFETQVEEAALFYHYGPHINLGLQVNDKGYLGVRYTVHLTNTDNLDGIAWRTAVDRTDNNDFIHKATVEYVHRFGTFNW